LYAFRHAEALPAAIHVLLSITTSSLAAPPVDAMTMEPIADAGFNRRRGWRNGMLI
jgi:hypothetical protein